MKPRSVVVPWGTGGRTLEFFWARSMIVFRIAAGLLYFAGSLAMRVRARPATWGVAMEVPLMVFVPVLPGSNQSLVMPTPGAKRSTPIFVPVSAGFTKLEQESRADRGNHTLSPVGVACLGIRDRDRRDG